MINIDEKESVKILLKVLKASGLKFRKVRPGEEGGFFYNENGVRKKFTENIFVKRSLKVEKEHDERMKEDEQIN